MPLQRHGGRLEQNEKYCGSCFGAETISHKMNKLSFGDFIPGVVNPLDGTVYQLSVKSVEVSSKCSRAQHLLIFRIS
ncbi:hypothetical protein ACS0TY_023396 [Phlomoides rotata]